MPSPQQLAANRANSQLSTGPTSSEGKAKVSHNALKTGLTGRTVLLPSDDVAAYHAHVERILARFNTETEDEKRLAQSLADTLWRLERIPTLESGIFALGRREFAAQFADEPDDSVRRTMLEAHIFLAYRRDLNNLSIQESRLRRQYEKDEAELKRQIAAREDAARERERQERDRWSDAIRHYHAAQKHDMPFDPAEIGFEFSIHEIAARARQQQLEGALSSGRYYEYKKKGILYAA